MFVDENMVGHARHHPTSIHGIGMQFRAAAESTKEAVESLDSVCSIDPQPLCVCLGTPYNNSQTVCNNNVDARLSFRSWKSGTTVLLTVTLHSYI